MAKEALSRIDERKRERIFRMAAAEFARYGYHKANVNSIAQKAGIGKGSIYLYFTDKRDLYFSTFKEAARLQNKIFDAIETMELNPIAKIKKVFGETLNTFPKYQNMFKMYYDLTVSGNEREFAALAPVLEKRSVEFYLKVLAEGIEAGIFKSDLSIRHAAYLIDCVYSIFVATLASSYQRERFRVFTDTDVLQDDSLIEEHMWKIVEILESAILRADSKRHDIAESN